MSSEKKRKRSSAAGAVSGSVKIIAAESSDLPPVVGMRPPTPHRHDTDS